MGPDQVPVELLKEIVKDPQGLTGLTELFQTVLDSGAPPRSWSHSVVRLLPKTTLPSCPRHLRPIALTSHISKVFVKILMSRMGDTLLPEGCHQCASPGRQCGDVLWATNHVLSLFKEWRVPAVILKTDLLETDKQP